MKRVDFRNVGKTATPGLIAMTIDDGTGQTDQDPAVDGIVVILNATNATQTVGGFKDGSDADIDLSGFVQSDVQTTLGTASIGTGATAPAAANGTFSVPAWSVAVFVKPQGSAQSTGLPVSKKQDPATIPPFGATPMYVKGLYGNHWAKEDALTFTSNYQYSLDLDVTADSLTAAGVTIDKLFQYGIKVADEGFSTDKNFGKCDDNPLVIGTPVTLCKGGDNVTFTATDLGTYHFVFTAVDKTSPTLTVTVDPAP